VGEILAGQQDLIKARRLTVANRVEDAATADADPRYWTHVLETLIHNALVFSGEGGSVTIETSTDQGKTAFTVTDDGRGFLAEDRGALFKPFILPPEKRNPEGFGLNLPLAKIIVEAHNGRLRAESPGPGKGATFTVEL
jgi:signal transduction histidine kinase